jgi:hypothetical protein
VTGVAEVPIRDLATGPAKREVFTKLAENYMLATEVQRAINDRQARGSE